MFNFYLFIAMHPEFGGVCDLNKIEMGQKAKPEKMDSWVVQIVSVQLLLVKFFWLSMIDLIIGIILMHFVPIITILYIYKPEHQE